MHAKRFLEHFDDALAASRGAITTTTRRAIRTCPAASLDALTNTARAPRFLHRLAPSSPECAVVRPSGLPSRGVACTLVRIAHLAFDMAWEHINLVRQVPLQYIAKLILFALASRVDDEGKCWPSIDTICHDTGLKHRTTQLHLKALVESGYVIRQERPGRTALLWINMRMLATGVSETAPDDLHTGVHALQNSGAGCAPEVEIEQPINRQGRKLSTTANRAASNTAPTTWWATPAGIDAKGRELQVLARPGEGYAAYKDRLFAVERLRREPP